MKNQSSVRGVASPVRAGGLGLTCGDYATAGKQSQLFLWDSVGQNQSRTVSEPVQNLSRKTKLISSVKEGVINPD